MNISGTYENIRERALLFADSARRAVGRSHNEAEFQRQMSNEIERLAQQLGVNLLFREQYTLATGRADAVYDRFVIEYEQPGSLRAHLAHGHTAHAVQQVKDYIVGLAKEERHGRDRLLGVAFDGVFSFSSATIRDIGSSKNRSRSTRLPVSDSCALSSRFLPGAR